MSRPTVALLSKKNLLHNIGMIRQYAPTSKIIAMVKANAYGHGIEQVGSILDTHVDMLGAISIEEAVALRHAGVKSPIILAQGVFEPEDLHLASVHHVHVAFNKHMQIDWLNHVVLPNPLNAWLKINTGMGRLGFELDEADTAYQALSQHPAIQKPVRIISHFACSEMKDYPLNQKQIQNFSEFIKGKETEYSLCNSAAIFNFPDCHYDYVRPGLAVYGVTPMDEGIGADLGLKPVMTMQTKLISIRHMKKGDTVGYSARYYCPEDMVVGLAAIGYGDGYPISAKEAPVLVNGIACNTVGRPAMDLVHIDLRPYPGAKIGDNVILWGDGLPLEHVAAHTQTITWNILTGIQKRVKFVWTD